MHVSQSCSKTLTSEARQLHTSWPLVQWQLLRCSYLFVTPFFATLTSYSTVHNTYLFQYTSDMMRVGINRSLQPPFFCRHMRFPLEKCREWHAQTCTCNMLWWLITPSIVIFNRRPVTKEPTYKTCLQNIMNLCKFNITHVVCFLLDNSPASEFYKPTFRNPVSVLSSRAGGWRMTRAEMCGVFFISALVILHPPALEDGTDRGFLNVGF